MENVFYVFSFFCFLYVYQRWAYKIIIIFKIIFIGYHLKFQKYIFSIYVYLPIFFRFTNLCNKKCNFINFDEFSTRNGWVVISEYTSNGIFEEMKNNFHSPHIKLVKNLLLKNIYKIVLY